jgi:ubiquitin fusion degradation protein 1
MFGMFGQPMGGGHFEAHYRAMPVAFIDKGSAEFGDKIILPPSALDRLGEKKAVSRSWTRLNFFPRP